MALSTFPASCEGNSSHDIPSGVLIDRRIYSAATAWAYNAIRSNAAPAYSETSQKELIEVWFSAAHPPALSRFAICIPSRPVTTDIFMEPQVVSADTNLVVLRVPQNYLAAVDLRFNDYFVYRIHAQRPELYLLPKPGREVFEDQEVAILNCGDGTYVVAALKSLSHRKPTFRLHLCRATDGIPGRWTSQEVSVNEPLRDSLYPIPDSVDTQSYHVTTKVITLGGDKGTVGWVDLWRGIILCDLLSDNPNPRDMPQPLPAEGSQISFRSADSSIFRDITVNLLKDTIKYIEMEIRAQEVPASCSLKPRQPNKIVAGFWRATTYKMPIPVTSWENWCRGCFISLRDLQPSFYEYQLVHRLMGSDRNNQEATEATMTLRNLQMSYPT